MAETCGDCGKWAQEIYWTHFQFTHFAKILPSSFDQQLVIPGKFSNNLRKKLPSLVVLKGPSGVSWTVELATHDDTYCFKHGWPEFAKDHALDENDLLIFKYNGESLFNVLILDRLNFCEKESSYFVRKCEHNGFETTRKMKENYVVEIPTKSNNAVECASENLANDDSIGKDMAQDVASQDSDVRILFEAEPVAPVRPKRNRNTRQSSTLSGLITTPSSSPSLASTTKQFVSNRRPVTEHEVAYALTLAEAASFENTCRIIMRPSHVYRKFSLGWQEKADPRSAGHSDVIKDVSTLLLISEYVELIIRKELPIRTWLIKNDKRKSAFRFVWHSDVAKDFIPTAWMIKNLSHQSQDVILRVGNGTWLTRFHFSPGRRNGGLSNGWRCFSLDNNLEEFDVCLFDLANETTNNDSIILDVRIFRVVSEITPLTLKKNVKGA